MPELRKNIQPILQLVFLFLLSIILAVFLAPIYSYQGMQAFGKGNEDNPWNSILYIAIVLAFTFVVLKIAKRRKKNLIKWIFLFGIGMTVFYVISPLSYALMFPQQYETWHQVDGNQFYADSSGLYILDSAGVHTYNGTPVWNGSIDVDEVRNFTVSGSNVAFLYTNGTAMVWNGSYYIIKDVRDIDTWNGSVVYLNDTGVYSLDNKTIIRGNFSWIHASPWGLVAGNSTSTVVLTTSGTMEIDRGGIDGIACDFTGDDSVDVAIAGSKSIHVYNSRGKQESSYRFQAVGVECGDADNDGRPELVAYSAGDIRILFFNGDYSGYVYNLWDDHIRQNDIKRVYVGTTDSTPQAEVIIKTDKGILRSEIEFYDPGIMGYVPDVVGIVVAAILVYLLHRYPEWYVVDTVGVIVAGGATAIFGISLSILPTMVLLIIMAIYDAISVYRTKHMIDLADTVMDLKLPILLVAPKERTYSFRKQIGLKKELKRHRERGAMFMGLGDVIIPSVLVISSLNFLPHKTVYLAGMALSAPALVAAFTVAGILSGYSVLMRFVLKGNPQAGLPLLNSGAIAGYIIGYILIYGNLTLGIL